MDKMLSRLIELLGDRHGSVKELADVLGLSPNRITDWKAGRVKSYPKYAPQIAAFYGVSLDWLTGLSDEKEKPAPISEDGLFEDEKLLMSMYREIPPEHRAEAFARIVNDLKKSGLI